MRISYNNLFDSAKKCRLWRERIRRAPLHSKGRCHCSPRLRCSVDSHSVSLSKEFKAVILLTAFSCKPDPEAQIFHIDIDPLKQLMPVFYIDAVARYRANAYEALKQLNAALSDVTISSEQQQLFKTLEEEHNIRMQKLDELAKPREDGLLTTHFVSARLRDSLPEDAVFCNEPVTETLNVVNQLKLSRPKSFLYVSNIHLIFFNSA